MSSNEQLVNCPSCTFENKNTNINCSICDNPLPMNKNLNEDLNFIKDIFKAEINKKIIENNMSQAYDIIPESFFSIDMLYIPIQINGKKFNALVDTGAQISVMSKEIADQAGLTNLIDYKIKGKTYGVGEQDILGKIWMTDIIVGIHAISCPFTILNKFDIGIIFGLDMLNTHKCIIDVGNKCLKIGDIEVKFIKKDD